MPLPAPAGTTQQSPSSKAPTLHTLPNGDVRVIQCAPKDILVNDQAHSRQTSEMQTTISKMSFASSVASFADLPQLDTLNLKCSRQQLQKLVGAYFHVGELVVDAEMEACRQQTRKCTPRCGDCAAGLTLGMNGLLKNLFVKTQDVC